MTVATEAATGPARPRFCQTAKRDPVSLACILTRSDGGFRFDVQAGAATVGVGVVAAGAARTVAAEEAGVAGTATATVI